MLIKLHGFKPASAVNVLQAFSDKLLRLAEPMCQSMTYDQCREKAMRRELSRRTDIAVYFCYPHSPWQRGSNENSNELVRQYQPKGSDLSGYSQKQLDAIADQINNPPWTLEGVGRTIPLWQSIGNSCSIARNTHPRSLKPRVLHFRFESLSATFPRSSARRRLRA